MQISDDTYVIATGPVYGNYRLNAQLVLVRYVEQPRIDRAGRALVSVEIARLGLKAELCDYGTPTRSMRAEGLAHAALIVPFCLACRRLNGF